VSHLSLDQAERFRDGEKLPNVDPDDERELRNWMDAFDFVKQYTVSGAPISAQKIIE